MTVDTESCDVSRVANSANEENCGLDVCSCKDLTLKVGVDCNGNVKHDSDVDANVNCNGGIMGDAGGSYVVVSAAEDMTADDTDCGVNVITDVMCIETAAEVQDKEVNLEHGQIVESSVAIDLRINAVDLESDFGSLDGKIALEAPLGKLDEQRTFDLTADLGEYLTPQDVIVDGRKSLDIGVEEVKKEEQSKLFLDSQVEKSHGSLNISIESMPEADTMEEFHIVETDNVCNGANPEKETTNLSKASDETVEKEPDGSLVFSENKAAQTKEVIKCIHEIQEDNQFSQHPENAPIFHLDEHEESKVEIICPLNDIGKSLPASFEDSIATKGEVASSMIESEPSNDGNELKTEIGRSDNGVCFSPHDEKLATEAVGGLVLSKGTSSCPPEFVSTSTVIEFGSFGPYIITPRVDYVQEVHNGDDIPAFRSNDVESERHLNNFQQAEGVPDAKLESELDCSSVLTSGDVLPNATVLTSFEAPVGSVFCTDALNTVQKIVEDEIGGSQSSGNGFTGENLICQESTNISDLGHDRIPKHLQENPAADAIDCENVEADYLTRPFNFLIRIPRYEDEKLKEQIREAQLLVDEKTRCRDAFREEVQTKRANCRAHGGKFEATKSDERAARRLVKLKRQEIDSVQSVVSRLKNAMSVEDIDVRLYHLEHTIAHDTLPLKEEKQFIREIKQLKHLREQLSSNMGSEDEIQKTMEQKDEIEERLKSLKKELESLKDMGSKAERVAIETGKKYDDESKQLNELQAQFRAADDVRQEAYTHLLSLKKQLYEKNMNFRTYKDDVGAAYEYSSRGNKEALHRLCSNQVETLMELWNTDDEFRKEYVRCNVRSTVRRLRTLDGRFLGPDEAPPVLPSFVDERNNKRLVSTPAQADSISQVSTAKQEQEVLSAEDRSEKSIVERKDEKQKSIEAVKPVSSRVEASEERQEEEVRSKEMEFARGVEESRKEELEAKLKEERRLEEKAKAEAALERKKRNAEKAQLRAELRAQKEVELKEKEREKRLKKKERKKLGSGEADNGNGNGNGNGGGARSSEIFTKTTSMESDGIKENNPNGSTKKPARTSHFSWKQSKSKPIPPPLRNRGRRRMQQWLYMIVTTLLVLLLFFVGNTSFFLNLQLRRKSGSF